MNFTGSFLNYKGVEITDELGHPIITLKKTGRNYALKFKRPSVHFDIIDGVYKEPEYVEIRSVPALNDLGVVVHVIPVTKQDAWFSKQNKRLRIFLRDSIQKEGKEAANLPSRMFCLYDKANGLIKLIGALAGPNGEGEWLRV